MGDEALGIVTSCWYSAEIENAINKRFVANFRIDWKYDPGFYAAATYTEAAVLEAALEKINGRIEDKPAFMKACRSLKNVETCAAWCRSTSTANVIGSNYIRKVERRDGAPGEPGDQDLPERQPVLDLQAGGVPEESGFTHGIPARKNLES